MSKNQFTKLKIYSVHKYILGMQTFGKSLEEANVSDDLALSDVANN